MSGSARATASCLLTGRPSTSARVQGTYTFIDARHDGKHMLTSGNATFAPRHEAHTHASLRSVSRAAARRRSASGVRALSDGRVRALAAKTVREGRGRGTLRTGGFAAARLSPQRVAARPTETQCPTRKLGTECRRVAERQGGQRAARRFARACLVSCLGAEVAFRLVSRFFPS